MGGGMSTSNKVIHRDENDQTHNIKCQNVTRLSQRLNEDTQRHDQNYPGEDGEEVCSIASRGEMGRSLPHDVDGHRHLHAAHLFPGEDTRGESDEK